MSVASRNAAAAGEEDSDRGNRMKAMVQGRVGSPDNLHLANTERPEILSRKLLLKVHTASVNPYDWQMVGGGLPFEQAAVIRLQP
jgi:NADPH:quinone reductase-like Zn-dependent oxidoreductase